MGLVVIQRTTGSTGNVTGPADSVDNGIVRFDGLTGKIIQGFASSPPYITDDGIISVYNDHHAVIVSDTADNPFTLRSSRARTTGQVITSGDSVLEILGRGWAGATNEYKDSARIKFLTEGTVNDTGTGRVPGVITFSTSQDVNSGALTQALAIHSNQDVVVGTAALATDATGGFPFVPTCPGTPTGAPTTRTGRSPFIYDSTNDLLYVYNGGWQQVGAAGSGDVVGPAASTDNAIVRFDSTTGKLIQDYTSGAPTISDTGAATFQTTMGLGVAADTANGFYVRPTLATTNQKGLLVLPVITSDASFGHGIAIALETEAAAFALGDARTLSIGAPTVGAGSSITTLYQLHISEATEAGTNWSLYVAGGASYLGGSLTIADAKDVILDTTTGTKIGTDVSQKLGFWNAAPVVQPAAAAQAAVTNSTGGTADGTMAAVGDTSAGDESGVINDNFTELWTLQDAMRTALVDAGLMKGAA